MYRTELTIRKAGKAIHGVADTAQTPLPATKIFYWYGIVTKGSDAVPTAFLTLALIHVNGKVTLLRAGKPPRWRENLPFLRDTERKLPYSALLFRFPGG